jgi:hypothetical protein
MGCRKPPVNAVPPLPRVAPADMASIPGLQTTQTVERGPKRVPLFVPVRVRARPCEINSQQRGSTKTLVVGLLDANVLVADLQQITFGTWRPGVQILLSRLKKLQLNGSEKSCPHRP